MPRSPGVVICPAQGFDSDSNKLSSTPVLPPRLTALTLAWEHRFSFNQVYIFPVLLKVKITVISDNAVVKLFCADEYLTDILCFHAR